MTLIFDPPVDAGDLAGRRVTVVGLGKGRTTVGLARYLVGVGARVTVTDAMRAEQLAEGLGRLAGTPVELVLGPSSDDAALGDADFVFVIPGIRPRSATILRAIQRDIPVLTEMGYFFRHCPAQIVGVTGTKGKSTTMTLVARVLERGTRRVVSGGNIGTAIIDLLPTITKDDVVVLELSSFQLETLGRSPFVAVVTNILADHLDHHGTREAYVAAKSNIVRWQGPRDIAVLNLDDPAALAIHTSAESELRGFSLALRPRHGAHLDEAGDLVLTDGPRRTRLCAARELRLPGRHNVANALAAAIVGDAFAVDAAAIADALRTFGGNPHRLEPVAEAGGVLWVDDSYGTNPFATMAALDAYDRTPVVILGGRAKGTDFAGLGRAVASRARAAILIGEAADDIEAAIGAASHVGAAAGPTGSRAAEGPRVERAGSLREAVEMARAVARPGDVVLLSPACASFDMFSSAEDRGDQFKHLVKELAS